ncbi:hypothetical protein BU16DRAFT_564572 [Lophium mytilinum]|uniref:Uncharacterized protein n=1 Tax=Lophium mytilinum TaxID=390894 RepID=A0A6A6QMG3_9PEZI|nr:hypothetical protein BU16DRAFT_564572 [Lophium mytilinum]
MQASSRGPSFTTLPDGSDPAPARSKPIPQHGEGPIPSRRAKSRYQLHNPRSLHPKPPNTASYGRSPILGPPPFAYSPSSDRPQHHHLHPPPPPSTPPAPAPACCSSATGQYGGERGGPMDAEPCAMTADSSFGLLAYVDWSRG